MTTTWFAASHTESDSSSSLSYHATKDQAQGTSYQTLTPDVSADNDGSANGELWLFAPSSTTYVKHFYSRWAPLWADVGAYDAYVAGYFNTTSAVNAIDFKFSSGNIDDGIIKLYGISKS
jgi:hypothetical protein